MLPNSQTKILHICKVYLPVKGGVQRVVQSITNSLSKHYTHHVLTSGEDGAIREQNLGSTIVTRCRSYLEIASMPIAPAMILETIRHAKKSSIICLHYPFPLADLALAAIFKMPPLAVYWHSNIVVQKKLKWLTYPLIYLTLRRATVIIVTSQRMIENSALLTRFRAKTKIIPYGLPAVDHAKIDTKTNTQKVYFALVGRHVSYKGIDIAIRALQDIDAYLVIAGDGPLYEQHKLLAQTLSVSDKITFKKSATDTEIVNIIHGSVALIVPSVMHNEAFALVQLEAMRLKKPVINTSLPSSVPTIARDQKEGITVEPSDSRALAEAMTRIASNKKLASTLGNNGYQRFNEHFTDHRFKHDLENLFEGLLSSRR